MKCVLLEDIATLRSGFTVRGKVEPMPPDQVTKDHVRLVQMKDLDEYNRFHLDEVYAVALDNVKQSHYLKSGDVLFRSRGVTNTAVHVGKIPFGLVAASPLVVIRVEPGVVDPAYLTWYLNYPGQRQISPLSSGTSVPNVTVSGLKGLEIPLPPLATQRAIADLADLGQQEQTLMAELADKRQTYLHALLSRCALGQTKLGALAQ
ncbi:restriction endonuclease subunit S [Nodosilinea sp. PGN35]|uniref:restriction endonuclease subunit S n=1 Tax=Nodosilinea sp. PGN35 TaxID=3020489 RepID=UPI00398B67C5